MANAAAPGTALRDANVVASVVERDYVRFGFGAYNTREDVEVIVGVLLEKRC